MRKNTHANVALSNSKMAQDLVYLPGYLVCICRCSEEEFGFVMQT